MNKIEPFRFWCQKVMPLVYDDSLSYYELLCKTVDHINSIGNTVNDVSDNFTKLESYVNTYFDNMDWQDEVNTALDEMAKDGTLSNMLSEYFSFRLNIAWAVGGEVNNSNFRQAFTTTLAKTKFLYIPEGNYNFDVIGEISVNSDCDILVNNKALFYRETGTDFMFKFDNCSVTWNGGNIRAGLSKNSYNMLYTSISDGGNGLNGGAIELNECTNSTIINLNVEWCKLPSVLTVVNCTNTLIKNCNFNYCLENCVHILEHCVQTVVDSCSFNVINIPNNPSGIYYCYAVASGLKQLTDLNITPPDILVYRNNVVKHSDDSGLDTHGATNVVIENNIIENCNTCITAYNDSRRVSRPAGWTMHNVIIRNNVCKSNYVYQGSNEHPYILVASPNANTRDSFDYIIENNVFETSNNNPMYAYSILNVGRLQNVIIRNNTFNGKNNVTNGLILSNCSNVEVSGNIFEDLTSRGIFVYDGTNAYIRDNMFANVPYRTVQSTHGFSYAYSNDPLNTDTHSVITSQVYKRENDPSYLISSTLGVSAISPFTNSQFTVTYNDGIITSTNPINLFYNARMLLNNRPIYVTKILSDYSAEVVAYSWSPTNGEYSMTIGTAISAPFAILPVAYSGNLNDTGLGCVYITGKVENEPAAWETWNTYYNVYTMPARTLEQTAKTQVAIISNNAWIRSCNNAGTWTAWKRIAFQ